MLLWWAVEAQIRRDRATAVAWVNDAVQADSAIFDQTIVARLGQRLTQDRRDEDFNACAAVLAAMQSPAQRQQLLAGIAKGLGSGTNATVPAALNAELARLLENDPNNTQLLIIAARLGNTEVQKATAMIADSQVPAAREKALITLLGEETTPRRKPVLPDPGTAPISARTPRALQRFGDADGRCPARGAPGRGRLKGRTPPRALVSRNLGHRPLKAVDAGQVPTDVDWVPPHEPRRTQRSRDRPPCPEILGLSSEPALTRKWRR